MKSTTAFVPNKKLILHFDVQQVLCLPADVDKDFYVLHLNIVGSLDMLWLALGSTLTQQQGESRLSHRLESCSKYSLSIKS